MMTGNQPLSKNMQLRVSNQIKEVGVSLIIGLTLNKSLNVVLFYTCGVQNVYYPKSNNN